MAVVLVVDDELPILDLVSRALLERGQQTLLAQTAADAFQLISKTTPDIAIVDFRLGTSWDGLTLFTELRKELPSLRGIMLTGFGTFRNALECGAAGFAEYLGKPFDLEELVAAVERVMPHRSLAPKSQSQSRPEVDLFDGMIGRSHVMREVFDRILQIAPIDQPVLILGETGTGKELVARSIHKRSRRCRGPFVAVNCAALPPTMFEAEFFGYERGAFTDARSTTPGWFERSNHGTLFLDEIGDLPCDLQAKLLRVVEHREVTRLGGRQPIPLDARIVAATNADLEARIQSGTFRQDLYWRLNALSLTVPPLRQRSGDIELLVAAFVRELANELQLEPRGASEEALTELRGRRWPGNIRELKFMLRAALLSARGSQIDARHLPAALTTPLMAHLDDRAPDGRSSLHEAVRRARIEVERQMIQDALSTYRTAAQVARALGMDPKTLYQKRSQYKL